MDACQSFGLAGECSGHGHCDNVTFTCVCDDGWSGHDNWGFWPQDCQVNVQTQHNMVYVNLAFCACLLVFTLAKFVRLWLKQRSLGKAAIQIYALGVVAMSVGVAYLVFELEGMYVGINAPNATGVLFGLVIGGYYIGSLELCLLFIVLLGEANVLQVSEDFRDRVWWVTRVFQATAFVVFVSLTILLNTINDGQATIYEVSLLIILFVSAFAFLATGTGLIIMYEMHSLRKFLLEFHKDGVVAVTRKDRNEILKRITLMLQTTVAVIIVSPIATVFILAWYPARRLTFVWEFVLIFCFLCITTVTFGYVLDLGSSSSQRSDAHSSHTSEDTESRSRKVRKDSLTAELFDGGYNSAKLSDCSPTVQDMGSFDSKVPIDNWMELNGIDKKAHGVDTPPPAISASHSRQSSSRQLTAEAITSIPSLSHIRTASSSHGSNENIRSSKAASVSSRTPSRRGSQNSIQQEEAAGPSGPVPVRRKSEDASKFNTINALGLSTVLDRPQAVLEVSQKEVDQMPPAARLFAEEGL